MFDEPEATLTGRIIGPYRVLDEIGRGGMGVVYAAEDTRLGRQVALKALPPDYMKDPVRRERLLWGRFESEEIRRIKAWKRTGYFGHTPVDNYPELLPSEEFVPIIGPGIVLLDTACALSPQGRLTAVCHENQTFHQADRFGNIVTES